MLNITLGLDVYNNTVVTDSLENLSLKNMSLDLIEADANVENTVDYLIAENNKKSKELLLKLEKSKALPTLNAFVNGG